MPSGPATRDRPRPRRRSPPTLRGTSRRGRIRPLARCTRLLGWAPGRPSAKSGKRHMAGGALSGSRSNRPCCFPAMARRGVHDGPRVKHATLGTSIAGVFFRNKGDRRTRGRWTAPSAAERASPARSAAAVEFDMAPSWQVKSPASNMVSGEEPTYQVGGCVQMSEKAAAQRRWTPSAIAYGRDFSKSSGVSGIASSRCFSTRERNSSNPRILSRVRAPVIVRAGMMRAKKATMRNVAKPTSTDTTHAAPSSPSPDRLSRNSPSRETAMPRRVRRSCSSSWTCRHA